MEDKLRSLKFGSSREIQRPTNYTIHKYCIAGYFRGTKFLQIAHFEDFMFEDRGSNDHTPTV